MHTPAPLPFMGRSARAEYYTEAAARALRVAMLYRDLRLHIGCPFDRRIDRALMREYARQWRQYSRLARNSA